jgi:hypothetical protein
MPTISNHLGFIKSEITDEIAMGLMIVIRREYTQVLV